MSAIKLKRIVKSLAIVFAVLSATGVQAGHRDTLGSSPGYSNSRHSSQHSTTRYSVTNREHRRAPNIARHTTRRGHDTSVNIIVGKRFPQSAFLPPYDYRYNNRRNRHSNNNAFNAGLGIGIISGSVLSVINSQGHSHEHVYEREYSHPVSRVETGRHGGRSITLLKDRYGKCFERETDRNGRTSKRRVADYKCDF